VNRRAALVGALLVTLARPVTWPLALAAFLIRGGIVVVMLPVVVLPTPIGLGNVLAPALLAVAFGSISVQVVAVTVAVVVGALAWLLVGGWLAAALEAEGARIVASDEDVLGLRDPATPVPAPGRGPGRVAARIVAARLLASLPLVVALALGSTRLVLVAYRELTSPIDVTTPIVLRVLRASPEVVVAIVLTWMLSEIVSAMAARRIALAGDGVLGGLRTALVVLVRSPFVALARFWLPTLAVIAILVPAALATASAWDAVRGVLIDRADPVGGAVAIVAFVGLWTVGLLLLSVVCAWRSAVWTVAAVASKRTFGGSSDRQPGDWRSDPTSATL
jgi:hypothetical protein